MTSVAQRRQLVHLQDLDVAAEAGALLGEVRVDVEHAAVVVPHHAEAVVLHHVGDAGGVDPVGDLVPGSSGSSSSMPVIWWNEMPARRNTFAISGTGQAGSRPAIRPSSSCGRPAR